MDCTNSKLGMAGAPAQDDLFRTAFKIVTKFNKLRNVLTTVKQKLKIKPIKLNIELVREQEMIWQDPVDYSYLTYEYDPSLLEHDDLGSEAKKLTSKACKVSQSWTRATSPTSMTPACWSMMTWAARPRSSPAKPVR